MEDREFFSICVCCVFVYRSFRLESGQRFLVLIIIRENFVNIPALHRVLRTSLHQLAHSFLSHPPCEITRFCLLLLLFRLSFSNLFADHGTPHFVSLRLYLAACLPTVHMRLFLQPLPFHLFIFFYVCDSNLLPQ